MRNDFHKLASVKNLNKNIKESYEFIKSIRDLISRGETTSVVEPTVTITNPPNGKIVVPTYSRTISFQNKISSLYKVGFILLYSNFEAFRVDLVEEYIKNHLDAHKDSKKISIADLRYFTSIEEAKDYYINEYATDKSRDLEKWHRYIKNTLKMILFEEEDWKNILIFNEIRNCYMHNNSMTSMKYVKLLHDIKNEDIKLNIKLNRNQQEDYDILYKILLDVKEGSYIIERS